MKEQLKIFKALSDETRLKIVQSLLNGERCVCEIIPFTKRAQSTVSLQLKKLESLGIVSSRRKGNFFYYKIKNENVIKIMKLLRLELEDQSKWKKEKC
jgi:ArsR family transcriptional regulator